MKIEKKKGEAFRKTIDFMHSHAVVLVVLLIIIASAIAFLVIIRDGKGRGEGKDEQGFNVTKELTFPVKTIDSFNPLNTSSSDAINAWQLLFTSLFSFNEDLSVREELVSSYDVDKENGIVRVKLKNATFSDGEKIDSSAIKNAVEILKDTDSSNPFYSYGAKISDVEVVDDITVNISFKDPKDADLNNLVFPIVKDYKSTLTPVTSGPYTLEKPKEDGNETLYLLKSREDFYNSDRKGSKDIILKASVDTIDTFGLATIGAYSGYLTADRSLDDIAKQKGLSVKHITSSDAEVIVFNFNNALLGDQRFRKAIESAINVKELIRDNYNGAIEYSDTIFYPNFLGVSVKKSSYNPQNSEKLLNKLGYTFDRANKRMKDQQGSTLTLRLLYNNDLAFRREVASSIKEDLEAAGIEVQLVGANGADYTAALEKKDSYDIALVGITMDPRFNVKKIFDKGGIIGYSNEGLLSEIDNLNSCNLPEEKSKVFKRVQDDLRSQVPCIVIGFQRYSYMTIQKLPNDYKGPFFYNIYGGLETLK